jgi:hypothetical protein
MSGKGTIFIRCEAGACLVALLETLRILQILHPSSADAIFFIEGSGPQALPPGIPAVQGKVQFVPGAVIEALARESGAPELGALTELEAWLRSGHHGTASLSVSVHSLAAQASEAAARLPEKMGPVYASATTPTRASCMVTSLYDEKNLLRLTEYVTCIAANLCVFERIAICYESTDGLMGAVLHQLARVRSLPPGRLVLMPLQKRPTFEELFSVQSLLPGRTLLAVANADVVFDSSIAQLPEADLDNNMVVLTRRNLSLGQDGTKLLHLKNGAPNIFSADAWIVSTPFEPDFFLDYPIGTMHCDSYINNQISRSRRYSALNPCFDVKAFHVHDERFNSTAEKQARDVAAIQASHERELARCGAENPLKGVAWSTIANGALVPPALRFQSLKTRVLIFEFERNATGSFGALLVLNYLCTTFPHLLENAAVVMKMPNQAALEGRLATLVLRYQEVFRSNNIQLDFMGSAQTTFALAISPRIVSLADLADMIAAERPAEEWESLLWPEIGGTSLRCCRFVGEMPDPIRDQLLAKLRQRRLFEGAAERDFIDSLQAVP